MSSVIDTTAANIRHDAAILQTSNDATILTKELDPVIMDLSLDQPE